MNYKVDLEKKKRIHKGYLHNCKGWMILSHGIIIIFILFNILFAFYGFVIKNSFVIEDITASNYGLKNTLLVWVIIIAVDLILAFLWFIQHILAAGISGKYISQRINENLQIDETYIEYGYQNAVGATPGDRVIVKIRLDSIKKIIITEKISKIEILGELCSVYYDNYINRKTRAKIDDFEEGTFIMFDYFIPKLIPYFDKNFKEKLEVS